MNTHKQVEKKHRRKKHQHFESIDTQLQGMFDSYHEFFSFTHLAFKQHPHQHIEDQKTITKPNFIFGKFRVSVPHGEIHRFNPIVGVLAGVQFHLKIHFIVFHVTRFEQHAGQTFFRPRRARNGACQGLVLDRDGFPILGTDGIRVGTDVGAVQVLQLLGF